MRFESTLHARKTNKNTYKIFITAEYSGVEVKLAPNFEMGVSNKTPQYLNMNPIGKAQIEQWIDFSTLEIDANINAWYRPRNGQAPYHLPVEEAKISALKRALGALNTHLASNTYLVGQSVTLADIIMTCNLHRGFTRLMTKGFTSEFPHVERYFWALVHEPKFQTIIGDVKQTEAVLPLQAPQMPY
ncbi:elongation factor 1-gamma-like isoform X3 [Prosopis cineraria]|uniref:elongation factor 1-gamma-like isoform X3 n=1 Tax=Prosopis cineraria TaxID=364024 RepID=UPI00240F0FD3|nr:elongation factor 1-gamma-like isoform X3 [Prosopis cineraria]